MYYIYVNIISDIIEYFFGFIFIFNFFLIFSLIIFFKIEDYLDRRQEEKRYILDLIESGQYFENIHLGKTILEEKNKDIIKLIYENIEKTSLTEHDLLKFLHKNKLKLNNKIYQILLQPTNNTN